MGWRDDGDVHPAEHDVQRQPWPRTLWSMPPADYDDDEEEALLGYERGVRDEDGLLSDEGCDALAADIDEFEGAIGGVDPEEISQEE
eukprot:4177032-Pyramimonas_sp.AAC.1